MPDSPDASPVCAVPPVLPATAAIVDPSFIAARAKLIDIAAFLDRVERHGVADDFRCAALREAVAILVDGRPERARRVLEHLSDPTSAPAAAAAGKAAVGAWRKPSAVTS